jgi:hypothetical protein
MMAKTLRSCSALVGLTAAFVYVGCASDGTSREMGTSGNSATGGAVGAGGGLVTGTGSSTAAGGGGLGLPGEALGGAGGDGSLPPLPPLPDEVEEDSAFRAPVATGDYLWFANPASSRVALIHALNLDVQVLSGGYQPTHIAPVPRPGGENSALVLNVGSSDATWFRVKDGHVDDVTFDTHRGANRLTVAPSGKWAVLWSAANSAQSLDPTEGLQDVTVVSLASATPKTFRLTVGYRPSQVLFDATETRIVVVDETGISLLDVEDGTPSASAWLDLGPGKDRDVAVTPSGNHALVRRKDDAKIEVVPLDGGDTTFVQLQGAVTDLDLSADGSRAVAVVREKRQLAVLPLPGIVAAPSTFDVVTVPGEVFGSAALTADGKTAALYTNAIDSDRVVVVDLTAGSDYLGTRVVSVKAPIESLTTTPDGEHAIALLGAPEGSVNAGSFALVPLRAERFPRVVGTLAETREVAVTSDYALVTTSNGSGGVFEAHLLRMPSLSVDSVRISSPPLAAGLLQERGLGYVAQSHPEGRVTILDFEESGARTLTGFELAAKVVE